MEFDANGMLPGGLHEYTFEQFLLQFVDGFSTSQRRKEIAKALVDFAREIYTYGTPYDFWIDGSYVTTKINPNDADIVVFLQVPSITNILPLRDKIRKKYLPDLDVYFAYATSPENQAVLKPNDYYNAITMRNYWRGQFGFDRADNPKGIVKINCESLLNYLKGGDINGKS